MDKIKVAGALDSLQFGICDTSIVLAAQRPYWISYCNVPTGSQSNISFQSNTFLFQTGAISKTRTG